MSNHFVKRPKRATRYIYGSEKVEKTFFCDLFKLKAGEFLAVKRGANFFTRYVKGVPITQEKITDSHFWIF